MRVPRDFFGDLESQLSACRTAEKRLQALAQRYGAGVVLAAMEGLLDRSERMARAEIAALPDGEYTFEDFLDNDGMDGPPQRLCVKIRIEGDELTADFTGTAPQVPTAINSPLAYSRSAFYLAVRSIMSPEIPNTAGFFRPLHMIAPEGTIINPSFPGAVGAMGISGYRLADTIFGALAKAAPHAVRAASEGGTTRYTFATTVDGKPSILSEALVGAWGGHATLDGIDGVANIAANMANSPIEMVESTYPVMVEEYGYEPDSEGAGRAAAAALACGGACAYSRSRAASCRSARAARSSRRGAPRADSRARPARMCSIPECRTSACSKGLETIHVPGDTVYLHVTPGAGGHGAPEQREPQLVARDVRDGKISMARARDVYRVAVSGDGVIDEVSDRALARYS